MSVGTTVMHVGRKARHRYWVDAAGYVIEKSVDGGRGKKLVKIKKAKGAAYYVDGSGNLKMIDAKKWAAMRNKGGR